MASLLGPDCRIKVSSVLNRETTLYGKQCLTDGSQETCWNSEAGSPQFIVIDFGKSVLVETIEIMFQGGFVGKVGQVQNWDLDTKQFQDMNRFYPEDINPLQIFTLANDKPSVPTTRIKIVFQESTDFFGRITIYSLEVKGQEL